MREFQPGVFRLELTGKKNAGGSAKDQRNKARIEKRHDEIRLARYQAAFSKWCEWMEQECEE